METILANAGITIAVVGLMWRALHTQLARLDTGIARLDARVDSLHATVADIDRRLARVEGVLSVTAAPVELKSATSKQG